jgi:hypothetical protein
MKQPNNGTTGRSASTSPPAVNSPEFRHSALQELRDMMVKGHLQLAPGDTVLPLSNSGISQTPPRNRAYLPSRWSPWAR